MQVQIARPRYKLSLERSPFTFTLSNKDRTLLTLKPYPADYTELRIRDNTITLSFEDATANLTLHDDGLTVHWNSVNTVSNAFPMTTMWYGQGELLHQLWPLNRAMLQESELLTSDNGATGMLPVQSPAWLSADGVAILAHSPVSVGINQPPEDYPRYSWDLGMYQAPFDRRPWLDVDGVGDGHITLSGPELAYDILLAEDLPSAYKAMVARMQLPVTTPLPDLFIRPTWTTWARYKSEINQVTVMQFAEEILAHRFPYHVMEIDDRWQTRYGDLVFDPMRFPNPIGMIETLHNLSFQVTAWIIPFFERKSQAFIEGAARNYLVQTSDGDPYMVRWWQGEGALLDVTNPTALTWFMARLHALQEETGLDGFKFDAGEAIYLPPDAVTSEPLISRNDYTHRYVDFVAHHFALTEVRSGWHNQSAPIFFRIWDLTSNWTHANGLRAVIPTILSLSITGYPFVLADMIGGNAYVEQPDAEMMIRWAQLNALLPSMQFSLAPWDYGEQCEELCRQAVELHMKFSSTLLKLAQNAVRTGEPIIRPVFWLAPHDTRALKCDDQFLVGNDILVAPVVEPGRYVRDIYLPPGTWRDYWDGESFTGPTVLESSPGPLDCLPIFIRES